jgi:nucleotide-binding universal stress UspA family protein
MYDSVLAAERGVATDYLSRLQSEWSKDGLSVTTVIREGLAAQAIHDVADELGAYAIAMASHGRSGVPRLVLGSVAERMLEQATVPLLLVRAGGSAGEASLHEILVPLDGSVLAECAIDQARDVLAEGGVIVLERVVEPIYQMLGDETSALVLDEDATSQAEVQAKAYLDERAAPLIVEGYRVATRVRRGRPASELLETVEKSNVDAIVMTTHGHTGPDRWLMGSVADEVFRHADRPVLLVSVRTLASRATGDYQVQDLMSRDVEVVNENESIISALRKLMRRRVSGAPVINGNGELIGVVTERDLIAWHARAIGELSKDVSNLNRSGYGERIHRDTVASVTTRPAVAIEATAELEAAVRMLLERGIRRLPVTENGRLVGIISRADILKAMSEHSSVTPEPVSV